MCPLKLWHVSALVLKGLVKKMEKNQSEELHTDVLSGYCFSFTYL